MSPTRKATKEDLRREIEALRRVGSQLANVAYNLAQKEADIDAVQRASLRGLYKQWDAIQRTEPFWTRRRGPKT